MKKILIPFLFLVFSCSLFAQPKLTIDVSKPGAKISPTHYGIFFEDINHAADGGLYAELIRNRSFEDASTPEYWALTTLTGTTATATLETTNLLNAAQTKALKLNVSSITATSKVRLVNSGYWGINVVNGQKYTLSFFAKRDAVFNGTITASLESTAGIQYAEAVVSEVGTDWQKYTCTLTATGNDPNARFALTVKSAGIVWFDVVSLFPPTFNNRENGLRPELAQLLVDMKPKFMRFPGGCFVEGDYLSNRFQWKNTIGKIEERPGHYNLWGYRTSDGMGYHEFLQLSEDLGAEPLYVVNVGLAHNDNQTYTSNDAYVQDALDALEYANGPVTSTYGAMRAANGHPEPFNIRYIEIGNENYFGNNYGNRYLQFYNAIKAKYPTIQCIGNVAAWGTDNPTWTFSHPVDLVDEHYYRNPQWFINQYNKYDTYSRSGAKIYVGEYAVTSDCGLGNLSAAIGEAVYMAGMEKNSDVVPLNSYAPIFVNVNDRKWSPDMIDYNASNVYCTPSYYVQKLFANNIGTVNVSVNDSLCRNLNIITGSVGLGTWATKADYSNVAVTNGTGATLFSDQFANSSNWIPTSGTWSVSGGVYSQTTTSTDCRSIGKTISDSVYTYSLKARKTSGNEGFLIIFGYKDTNNFYWWNIGGWNNTQHAIEQCVNGTKSLLTSASGSVTTNKWYDVRIVISKTKALFYLDNVLVHTLNTSTPLLYTSATLDESGKQLFIKVINPANSAVTAGLDFKGLANNSISGGLSTVLTSASSADENSLTEPQKVVPVTNTIGAQNGLLSQTFPANSVTVLQLNTTVQSAVSQVKTLSAGVTVYPHMTKDYVYLKGAGDVQVPVSVYNLFGKMLLKMQIGEGDRIDLSRLASGVYIVKADKGNQTYPTKIIKE